MCVYSCVHCVPVYSAGQGSSERRNDHVQQPIISQSSRAKTGELIATRVRTAVSRFRSPCAIVCMDASLLLRPLRVAQDSFPLKKILHVKRKKERKGRDDEILEYFSLKFFSQKKTKEWHLNGNENKQYVNVLLDNLLRVFFHLITRWKKKKKRKSTRSDINVDEKHVYVMFTDSEVNESRLNFNQDTGHAIFHW